MEPATVVLGLAAIIGTGALTKIGENMTDRSPQAVNKLFSWMRQRLPQSKTVVALQAGKDIDYQQAVIELEPILAEGEGAKLLAEVRSAVAANQELKVQLEKAIAKRHQNYCLAILFLLPIDPMANTTNFKNLI